MVRRGTIDTTKYEMIIRSLIPYAKHDRLVFLVNKLVDTTDSNVRFEVINEIKSRATEYGRVLDFRSMFHDCCEVKRKEISHYLDKDSEALFHQLIEENHGFLNSVAYHTISKKASERYAENKRREEERRDIKSSLSSDDISLINLVNNNIFLEEQPDFTSRCGIFPYSPVGLSDKGRKNVAKNVTIKSFNYKRLLIETPVLLSDIKDNKAFVWIYDHHPALEYDEDVDLICEVKGKKKIDTGYIYQLDIVYIDKRNPMMRLKSYFNRLAYANKTYQKSMIPSLVNSVSSKIHEQFYIPTVQDLMFLCSESNSELTPTALLKTRANEDFVEFLTDYSNTLRLSGILSHPLIKKSLKEKQSFTDYLYILRTKSRKVYHYHFVFQSEINGNPDTDTFINKHVLEGDYRLIKLDIRPIDAKEDAYVPAAVPSYVGPEIAFQNRSIPLLPEKLMEKSGYMAVMSEITQIRDLFKGMAIKKKSKNQFIHFSYPAQHVLRKKENDDLIEIVRAQDNDVRTEDRFDIEMEIEITKKGSSCSITGKTVNVSTRGLLISLDEDTIFKPGESVSVSIKFPDFYNSVVVKDQPYLFLGQNESGIRLMISHSNKKHLARQSIRKLIYLHMDKLKSSGQYSNEIYGLQRCLRNVMANNHKSVPFFIHQTLFGFELTTAALNKENALSSLIKNHADEPPEKATLKLLKNAKFNEACLKTVNRLNQSTPSNSFYLFIIPRGADVINTFWIKDISELLSSDTLINAINSSKNLGKPTVLKVQISKPARILDKYYVDELKMLERLSEDKATAIENAIGQVAGIGEISDHTNQFMLMANQWIKEFTPKPDGLLDDKAA